jgi:hypothetical protein
MFMWWRNIQPLQQCRLHMFYQGLVHQCKNNFFNEMFSTWDTHPWAQLKNQSMEPNGLNNHLTMTNNAFLDDFAPNQQIGYCSLLRRSKCKSFWVRLPKV